MLLLCLFVACTAFINQCEAVKQISEEARLSNMILTNYQRLNPWQSNRPVLNTSDTVNVSLGVSFVDIVGYNPDTKVAQFSLFELMRWQDPFMEWDPNEFGGVKKIHVPISVLWKPDILQYNRVSAEKEVMDEGVLAMVNNDGVVLYIPPTIRNVRCLEDPVLSDMLHCDLKYGSWTYESVKLDLHPVNDLWNFDFADARINGQWFVHQSSASRNIAFYDCCPEAYTDITYHVEMRKKTKKQKEDVYWLYDSEESSNERN